MTLLVSRPKSIAALKRAQNSDNLIVTLLQKTAENEEALVSDLHRVGTLCKIDRIRGSDREGYQVIVRGVSRFRAAEVFERGEFIESDGVEWLDSIDADQDTLSALMKSLKTSSQQILDILPGNTRQLSQFVDSIEDLSHLTHVVSANIDVSLPIKQDLLEKVSLKERALKLLEVMTIFRDNLTVQNEIRDKLNQKLGKNQRDAILREQRRAIDEELGEVGEGAKDNYRKKIDDAQMPEEVRRTALEELKRLESIGNNSPESHVIRNYLDLLCSMPWNKASFEDIDLEKAKEILNQDHYGLEKIKKRIIQHLAVMKLKKDVKGSILLFVGPPGVGKTSLGQSIARALGRKFVRGSLGGVRDDAEIRGHRRTYIGAMPGRIIQGIKRAGENNPVFMLDEIDKLGRGFQGDPGGALLEVLDPEQNSTFLDHYLDVPFDLSKVMFIATANSLDSIPRPLLDRMEVIDVSGYTIAEKKHIAREHLIPKVLKEHGLESHHIELNDEVLSKIISGYTREAGVRELQRQIASVFRAMSEKVLEKNAILPIRVDVKDLDEVLGQEKFVHEVVETQVPPGVVTGLAWTPQGGEILFVESSLMPGTGKLTLTGQLGDVMKESAQIALSVVRAYLPLIAPNLEYEKKDLHIHVPAGAIPKDGPSAGIAMLTTMASLFSGKSVSPKIAMTGEVTLRGAVTPVGGIKEKVIGAHRAGIKQIIMSKKNKRDLREVPEEVKSQIRFDFVDNVEEVLSLGLGLDVTVSPISELTLNQNRNMSPPR